MKKAFRSEEGSGTTASHQRYPGTKEVPSLPLPSAHPASPGPLIWWPWHQDSYRARWGRDPVLLLSLRSWTTDSGHPRGPKLACQPQAGTAQFPRGISPWEATGPLGGSKVQQELEPRRGGQTSFSLKGPPPSPGPGSGSREAGQAPVAASPWRPLVLSLLSPLLSSLGERPEVTERTAFLPALQIWGQVRQKAGVAGLKKKRRGCVCTCGGGPGGQGAQKPPAFLLSSLVSSVFYSGQRIIETVWDFPLPPAFI